MDPVHTFNKAAFTYDDHTFVQRICAFRLAKTLYSFFPKISSFCDLGSGTGHMTKALMKFYPESHYHLVDYCKNMIEESRKKFGNRCTYEINNLLNISLHGFPVSNFVFQWLHDIPSFKQIAFTTLVEGTWHPWIEEAKKFSFPTHPFLSQDHWIHLVEKHYKNFYFFTEQHIVSYKTIFDFLHTIKKMGGSGSHHHPHFLLPLLRSFPKGIDIPYEVLYVITY